MCFTTILSTFSLVSVLCYINSENINMLVYIMTHIVEELCNDKKGGFFSFKITRIIGSQINQIYIFST